MGGDGEERKEERKRREGKKLLQTGWKERREGNGENGTGGDKVNAIKGGGVKSINQSINVKFLGRRYTTRPGAPTVVSGKHDHKVHS